MERGSKVRVRQGKRNAAVKERGGGAGEKEHGEGTWRRNSGEGRGGWARQEGKVKKCGNVKMEGLIGV